MPFTVSCPACSSRFLLGDDLFRRKVSGNIVTVKCRNCEAEISVDARDLDTVPSQQPPRRAPPPPRPKELKEKLGLDPAVQGAGPAFANDPGSIWQAEHAESMAPKVDDEPESVDFEELPPASSSDAPPLYKLTHEPGLVHPPRRKQPANDLLSNVSASSDAMLGAPTIDMSEVGSPPPQPDVEAFEIMPQLGAPRASMGTIPLFDMSEVLSAANGAVTLGSTSPEPLTIDFEPGTAPISQSIKARERKYVVAPEDAEADVPPAAHPSKRGGVFVGLAVAAVAAGVLGVVSVGAGGTQRVVATVSTVPADPPIAAANASAPTANAAPLDDAPLGDAPGAELAGSAVPAAARAAPQVVAPAVNAAPTGAEKNIPTKKIIVSDASTREPEVASAKTPEATTPTEIGTTAAEARRAVEPAAPGTAFDRNAAISALKSAAAQASSCRKDGDPSGTATLTITFAESGRVTSATIQGPPFAGTATGGCIASTLRHAQIPAFDGDRVTVTKTVVIE